MTETASSHRIGKFEFSVEVEKTKCEAEQRAAALANWLLVEWERLQASSQDGEGSLISNDNHLPGSK